MIRLNKTDWIDGFKIFIIRSPFDLVKLWGLPGVRPSLVGQPGPVADRCCICLWFQC